jgi:hypothetical protein
LALRLQILLVCVLLGLYLLPLSPAPDSADGNAIAAVATSWVRSGSPNMNAVAYQDSFMFSEIATMGSVGTDEAFYSKKGVTPSLLLMPLVVLVDALPWLTPRATFTILSPLALVAAALLLFRLTAALGFRLRTALVVAFSFGVGTFTFSYTKTLSGEPIACLLLMLAVYKLYLRKSSLDLLIAGVALGLLIGVNTVYVTFMPLLCVLAWLRWRKFRDLLIVGVPVAAALAFLALYNWARFGDPLNSGYHFAAGEGFINPLGVGMFGLFLGPFRGLFWYSPLLLLALPGWLMLRKAQSWLAWTILLLVLAQGAAFAMWWSWHGGVVWGPRFLLPIVPLLALLLAPLVEAAWTHRGLLVIFVGLFALSAFITGLGTFYSHFIYINSYLNTHYFTGDFLTAAGGYTDEVLYNPLLSPIVGHLALLVAGIGLEPAWIQQGDWLYPLLALAIISVGIFQMFIARSIRWRVPLVAALVFILLQGAFAREAMRQPGDALDSALQPEGTIVAATTFLRDALIDVKQPVPMIAMNAPTTPDDAKAGALWRYALRQRELLWFLTWFRPADAENWQERDLWQRFAFVRETEVLDHRVLLFDLHPDPAQQPVNIRFGNLLLESYGVEVRPNGTQVVLRWSAAETPDQPYSWFVHLLDASGNIAAQQDRQPQGGYAPTNRWQPGQVVEDRLFFPAPLTPDAQTWHLRIGWVDGAGALLPVTDANGVLLPESFVLLPLS